MKKGLCLLFLLLMMVTPTISAQAQSDQDTTKSLMLMVGGEDIGNTTFNVAMAFEVSGAIEMIAQLGTDDEGQATTGLGLGFRLTDNIWAMTSYNPKENESEKDWNFSTGIVGLAYELPQYNIGVYVGYLWDFGEKEAGERDHTWQYKFYYKIPIK